MPWQPTQPTSPSKPVSPSRRASRHPPPSASLFLGPGGSLPFLLLFLCTSPGTHNRLPPLLILASGSCLPCAALLCCARQLYRRLLAWFRALMLGMHVSKAFLAWSGGVLAPLAGLFWTPSIPRGYVPLWPDEGLAVRASGATGHELAVLLPHQHGLPVDDTAPGALLYCTLLSQAVYANQEPKDCKHQV